jgi:FMN phosphatase YigB (HAD superfamily)
MIKGIAFDLQFTLVQLEDFSLEHWFQLFDAGFEEVLGYLNQLGLSFDERRLKQILRRVRNKYFALIITTDQQYFTEEILGDTFSKSNIALDTADQFENCCKLYHSIEIPAWKPFPYVLETLEQLSRVYNLTLITNASPFITEEILRLQKMQQYFSGVLTKARKPRPGAFHQFKEAMKARFDELIMVGDDITTDIAPAIELGMKTIHTYRGYEYLKHHAEMKVDPDKVINKFEDIIQAIDELKSNKGSK